MLFYQINKYTKESKMRIASLIKSIGMVALVLPMAFSNAVISSAYAEDKVKLRLGWVTTDSPDDPYGIGAVEFKSQVEKMSEGKITVELYPNRQLGDEKELLEGVRFGTIDLALVVNAVIANVEPSFQINDMPFLFSDSSQAANVLDGEVGDMLAEKLKKKGIVVLGYHEGGFRSMLNNVRPVVNPEDVDGVKYRVMQNPVYINMFQALGGNAIPMAWGETFTAMQQGTIGGLEMPVPVAFTGKYNEVAKYLSLTRHTYSVTSLLMSEKSFKKLTPELQEVILKAAKVSTANQRNMMITLNQKVLENLASEGMAINEISDVSAFREKVKPVYEKFRKTIGDEIMDTALNAVQ